MSYFITLFFIWSTSNIIVHGAIFKPMRKYILLKNDFIGQMVTCMMCLSFWIGLFWSISSLFIFDNFGVSDLIILSFSGSGFSYILDLFIWKFFLK
jgi:hypothetical protein